MDTALVIGQTVVFLQIIHTLGITALHGIAGDQGPAHRVPHDGQLLLLRLILQSAYLQEQRGNEHRKHSQHHYKPPDKAGTLFLHALSSLRPDIGHSFYRMLEMMPAMGSITLSSTPPMTMASRPTMVGSIMDTRPAMPSSTRSSYSPATRAIT